MSSFPALRSGSLNPLELGVPETDSTLVVQNAVHAHTAQSPTLTTPGAFPTTSVLDAFNRANEGPPPSSNWTTGIDGGTGSFTVTSNEARLTNGTLSSAYWNAANFGPDVEVYATIGSSIGPSRLHFRIQQEGTAGHDGYALLAYTPTNELYIYRIDNGTQTQLGAAISQTISSGDSFGVSMIGSTITIYYKVGAGAWTSLGTRSDGTYTSAGKIGMAAFDNAEIRIDNFGGGTVTAVVSLIVHYRGTHRGVFSRVFSGVN